MMDSTLRSEVLEEDQEGIQKENDDELLVLQDKQTFQCPRDVLASLIACIGSLIMGLILGYSSPALNNEDFVSLLGTPDNKLWFGSLIAVGAIIGSPIAGILRDKYGLKFTLMFCNVPLGFGWLMIIIGRHVISVLFGRILTGMGVGIISLAVPLYVAEVSEKSRRGILGCCFQLAITAGILLSYALGMILPWNYLALTCLAVSTIYIGLLIIIPESPRWFISHKMQDSALESLKWLFNCEQRAEIELAYLQSSTLEQEVESSEKLSCSDMFLPEIYKPILIGIGLMVFQQMSGINAVLFYLAPIFSSAGFQGDVAMPTIIVGGILVLSTCVSCVLIDRLGRRVLLLSSGVLMALSLAAFGLYYYLVDAKVSSSLSWLSLTSVSAFICTFSLGWSAIPWLATAEIIPPRAKGVGLSLTTITNWLFVFLTTKFIDQATVLMTHQGTMWFFGCCCLVGCVFVAICLPETKGSSLEEIQKHFAGRERRSSDTRH